MHSSVFNLLISAYNSLAFFACSCLLALSTAIIHSQLIILLIYATIPFSPDPWWTCSSCGKKSQILSQSSFKVQYWKGAGYQRCNCSENPAPARGSGLEQAQRLQKGGRWRVKSVQWVCRVPRTLSANRFCGQWWWRLLISLHGSLPSFSLGWADWIHAQEQKSVLWHEENNPTASSTLPLPHV